MSKQKKRPRANGASESNGQHGQTSTLPPVAGQVQPTEADLHELREKLAKALTAKEKLEPYDMHARRKADAKIDDLTRDLHAGELQTMPLPQPTAAALNYQERPIAIATIRITGNHRDSEDSIDVAQLARSLQIHSLQQRIAVHDSGDGSFELIFGSRRLAAGRRLLWEEIPAKVYRGLTPVEIEVLRTIENFGRRELSHVERAIAVARILDSIETTLAPLVAFRETAGEVDFDPARFDTKKDALLLAAAALQTEINAGGGLHGYIGRQLGFPAKWVSDHAYVAELGGEARKLLAARRIDIGHARELAKLGDRAVADRIADLVARDEAGLGGRDVDYTRQQVTESLRSLRSVSWRLDVAFGEGRPGCTGYACKACRFNSKSDPDLFGGSIADEPEAGFCTNEACFAAKTTITLKDLERGVEKAKKLAAKDEGFSPTDSFMQTIIPVHVKPSSAARRAKKELEPATIGSKPGGVSSGSRSGSPKPTPEETAKVKLDQAVRQWRDLARTAIRDSVVSTPGRLAAVTLLRLVSPFSNSYDLTPEGVDEGKDILSLALKADTKSILALEAAALNQEEAVTSLDMGVFSYAVPNELMIAFLKGWKIDFPPVPTAADFLPKPKPDPEPPAPAGRTDDSSPESPKKSRNKSAAKADGQQPTTFDQLKVGLSFRQLEDGRPRTADEDDCFGVRPPTPDDPGRHKWKSLIGEPVTVNGGKFAVVECSVGGYEVVYRLHPVVGCDPAVQLREWGDVASEAKWRSTPPEGVPLAGIGCHTRDGRKFVFSAGPGAIEVVCSKSDWITYTGSASAGKGAA